MTDRIFTNATETICNVAAETYAPFFNVMRDSQQEMLVNSEVHIAAWPQYVRHWTNAEDAQAWADVVNAFAAEHNFDMKCSVSTI